MPRSSPTRFLCCVPLACALLAGCSGAAQRPSSVAPAPVDFSGAWEVDYSQSENVRDAYERLIRELERQARRRAEGGNQGPSAVGAVFYGSSADLYALARMAEIITEPQLLDIVQGESDISVKREGSFALECDFGSGDSGERESPLGREACGWRDHQLLFLVELPDGLRISHRFTLAPDGNRLQVYTQLSSGQVSRPFGLARVYNRYDPSLSGITCTQTLSKGRVCTTEKPGQ